MQIKTELSKTLAEVSLEEMTVVDLKNYTYNNLLNYFSNLSEEELQREAIKILGINFKTAKSIELLTNKDLKKIYKHRLMNLIEKRGDNAIFELSIELMDDIELEYKLKLTNKQVKMLENIVEKYKETGLI